MAGREMLLGKNFDDIDQMIIRGLVDAGATESVHLDFKRQTYGNADGDKREILKDVTSFANCLGGHLVIGVDEKDGAASAVTPLTGIDVDQELLRLENVVRTGIEPTVVGLRMKRVQVGSGDVIIIHVPRSFNPPHRVIFKNTNRYYSRNSSGSYELSLEELRILFGQQRTIEERAEAFVNTRFLKVQANAGAMPMPVEQGGMVMHLVPLPDFGADRRIDVAMLRQHDSAFCPIGASGYSPRVNLEGLVVYRGGAVCHGYTQVFRHGSLEATSASVFSVYEGNRSFGSIALPERIIRSLSSYIGGMKALEASPPILLQLSFFGMHGVQMGVDRMRVYDLPPPCDREEMHLPPTVITDYRDDGNYEQIVAEQMHFLWNAFSFERCFYFDKYDRWIGE